MGGTFKEVNRRKDGEESLTIGMERETEKEGKRKEGKGRKRK